MQTGQCCHLLRKGTRTVAGKMSQYFELQLVRPRLQRNSNILLPNVHEIHTHVSTGKGVTAKTERTVTDGTVDSGVQLQHQTFC